MTITSAIDQGLDRKLLTQTIDRFERATLTRIRRTRDSLTDKQQKIFDVLPMLFHVNHPMLPGYVSQETPKGLANFTPSQMDIRLCKQFARSFVYHRGPSAIREIHSLFLMGSCGSIAQTHISDLDIWVCHEPGLEAARISQLERKARRISEWSATFSLEVHFFVMDCDAFRNGQRSELSGEDCGSAQHYLLLDEFYRTSLLLGGRPPIWWMVPPDEDVNYDYYTNTLRDRRFIRPSDTIDFGGIPEIPDGEFVGAGTWQLYKAIEAPYKSLLKLLLTEAYACEQMHHEILSQSFKRMIYEGCEAEDELDPYVMIYRHLERYLRSRDDVERLELVRRGFYVKTGVRLSRIKNRRRLSWRQELVQKLVDEWKWPLSTIKDLDQRNDWRTHKVQAERKLLVSELVHSYRFLSDMARHAGASASINLEEMTQLGRQLSAAFERKPGKIESINPGISKNLSEDQVCVALRNREGRKLWAMYSGFANQKGELDSPSLYKNQSLLDLLVWAIINAVLDQHSRIQVSTGEHFFTDAEAYRVVRRIREFLEHCRPKKDEKHFRNTAKPVAMLIVINLGANPASNLQAKGLHRLSDKTDALSFSALDENLVLNVEQLTINTWGEYRVEPFSGPHALANALNAYLRSIAQQTAAPILQIYCCNDYRAHAIEQRVLELFEDSRRTFFNADANPLLRYVVQIGRAFYCYSLKDQVPQHQVFNSESQLLEYLSRPRHEYSPIIADRHTLLKSPLRVIIPKLQQDNVQVFLLMGNKHADLYVCDETGALIHFTSEAFDGQVLLSHLHYFLTEVWQRRQLSYQFDTGQHATLAMPDLLCYELKKNRRDNAFQTAKMQVDFGARGRNFYPVQAFGQRDSAGEIWFSILCGDFEFSELEYGESVYEAAAKHILGQRRSGDAYPCYLSDLDLSHCLDSDLALSETAHYLIFKLQIERRINSAMRSLAG